MKEYKEYKVIIQSRIYRIPDYMMGGIERYIKKGYKPGSFLSAVIQNDLREACGYADAINIENLPAYASFFYNEAPHNCWGSKQIMEEWMEEKHNDKSMPIS